MNSIMHSLRSNTTRRITRSAIATFHFHPLGSHDHQNHRPIHTTSTLHNSENINNIKQGHIINPKNVHPQDTQAQSTHGGFKAKEDKSNKSIDAAKESEDAKKDNMPKDTGKGNPEGIGFVEQVGGASGTARKFEK